MHSSEVIARRYVHALNKNDGDTILKLFADDAEVVYPGGGPLGGRHAGESIKRLYSSKARDQLSVFEVSVTNTVARGGLVAMEFSSTVAGADRKGTFKTSGSLFFDISDGKIHRLSIYVTPPEELRYGVESLSEELSVRDMGLLSAVAWAVV